jgi:hypothetical protein
MHEGVLDIEVIGVMKHGDALPVLILFALFAAGGHVLIASGGGHRRVIGRGLGILGIHGRQFHRKQGSRSAWIVVGSGRASAANRCEGSSTKSG